MGKAFGCYPYVDTFCLVVYSLQSATLFIAVFSMVRGIIISSYFFAPFCLGIRATEGPGFLFYLFEAFQFGTGLFLLCSSILLAFSTCIEHPTVKVYIISVYIASVTSVIYSVYYFFFLSMRAYKCEVIYFDETFKLWHPQGAIGHFVHILWQIALAALMIYFTIVVNSHAMNYDSGRMSTLVDAPYNPPPAANVGRNRRRRRNDEEDPNEP